MDEFIRELKRAGVLSSPHVEAAFRAIDRKDFVPPEYRDKAYADHPLPIGNGQTISQPYTVAFMLDLLDPRPGEKILDVGAGSGWQSTLLAHVVSQNDQNGEIDENDKIGKRLHRAQRFIQPSDSSNSSRGKVYAVERISELCKLARRNIGKYGFLERGTVELRCGDAAGGLPNEAPFDKIIAAAAGDELPAAWRDQLKIGGVIVAPIGSSIWRYTKRGLDALDSKEFRGFAFVPLIREDRKQQITDSRNQKRENGKRKMENGGEGGVRRRRRSRFIAFCILTAAGAVAYTLLVPVAFPKTVRIDIAPGSGSRAIADQLKSKDIIRSKWLFLAYAALTGKSSSLKPGAYEFGERIAIPSLVAMLVRGEPYPNERFITIPEGWDLRDIGNYLEVNGVAARRDLYAVTGDPARRYDAGHRFPPREFPDIPAVIAAKPPSAILEGWLYPDTYRVFRNASAADIVAKMLENFDRKLTSDLRAEIARRGKSVTDIITLASLIEKEVAGPEDRRVVAGILWGRLAADMALQVDATVNYITGKRETPSANDLAIDSPYNTYRYRGLPPTAISNPGINAIRAAVFPQASDYAYYLSTPDGRTIFSRTFEEHTRAKARYLR